MRLYKPFGNSNKVLKDEDGQVMNENQITKVIYTGEGENTEWSIYTESLPRLGFSHVELVSAKKVYQEDGETVKSEDDEELKKIAEGRIESIYNPQEELTPEEKKFKAIEEQNKLLQAQIKELMDSKKEETVEDTIEALIDEKSEEDIKKELRQQIKEKGGDSRGLKTVEKLEERLAEL